MKPFFLSGKTLLLLAAATAAAVSVVALAQTETAPTPSRGNAVGQTQTETTPALSQANTDSQAPTGTAPVPGQGNIDGQTQTETAATPAMVNTLPASVVPGSPLAEVVKLIQAGVDVPTIQSFIANSQSQFNLDADKIIFLKDEGAPSEVINAMMDRDKALYASTVAPQASPPPPAPTPAVDPSTTDTTTADTTYAAPPAEDVTVNYFYDTLTPYGSWLNVDGVGQCWRPSAVIYDAGWRPYCDRGHWVYTDYGWYWDSDYGWGATFHYGRWFNHPRFGWCWYPDTVWAPSWVTWRSDVNYCGWAPLPPSVVFMPGSGFFFQGAAVGLDCGFGLGADSFVFVSPANFCDRHPRSFVVQPEYVRQIFSRTKVINSFSASGRTIANHGFGAERIASVTHRTIEPVHVSSLPNAGRQGWRGEGFQQTMQRNRVENINPGQNFPTGNNFNNNGSTARYQTVDPASQQGGDQAGFGPPQPNVNNRVQSQAYYNQQQQQQQTRQYNNAYGAANERVLQNNQNGWQQNRAYNNASTVAGAQQHGAEQWQEHQYVAPAPPRPEEHQTYFQSGGRNYNTPPPPMPPAPPQNQPQTRNSGNGGNGSNGGGNSNGGSNKQNH